MTTILTLVFGWLLLQSKQREREKHQGNGFLDVLAASKPQRKPEELYKIIHSAHFSEMNIGENAMLLNEMVLALIKPGMGENEVAHVKSTLFAPIISIITLQNESVYGGNSGQPIN